MGLSNVVTLGGPNITGLKETGFAAFDGECISLKL